MKFEIMLKILFELLSKRCVKASYLAREYDVSIRSIHRYVSALEMAGVPIYSIRGNNGGFAIVDTYRLNSTFMTENEFTQTINALSAITESVPNKVLSSAVKKLQSVIKNEYSGLKISSGNLIIDAGPWGDTVGYKSKLKVLQDAIEQCKVLSITYHDRNGEISTRDIEPHVIVFKQGLWYVFAYCRLRNDFRFFKTGRIEQATILSDKFVRKDISKLDLPIDYWIENVKAENIVLEVEKSCISDIEEWLGVENVKRTDGKFIVSASLPYDNGLVSKILSFGNGVTVLEPNKLKTEIINQSKNVLEKYK